MLQRIIVSVNQRVSASIKLLATIIFSVALSIVSGFSHSFTSKLSIILKSQFSTVHFETSTFHSKTVTSVLLSEAISTLKIVHLTEVIIPYVPKLVNIRHFEFILN